jgi:hypothetical protein
VITIERSADRLSTLALLFAALLAGLFATRCLSDFDVLWHVRTGEWILAERHVPRTDPFGEMTRDAPWVDVAWGADVVGALLVRAVGLTGLQLCIAAVVVGTFLTWTLCLPRSPLVLVAGLTFVLAAWQRFLVRPDVLAFPLVLVLLALLERLANGIPRTTWLLSALAAVWANVHGSFVLVPVLLVAATLGAMLARLGPATVRAHAIAVFAATAGCLANPYGVRVFLLLEPYVRSVLATLGVTPPGDSLGNLEWAATWRLLFRDPVFPSIPFALMTVLLALSFARVGTPIVLRRLPIALALLVLALGASRNILPFAAGALFLVGRNERDRPGAAAVSRPGIRLAAAAIVCAVAVLYLQAVLTDRFYVRRDVPIRTGVGPNLELVPEGAVQWLAAHASPGRVYNNYDSGAYLLYRLFPVVRPYIDSRMDMFEHGREVERATRDPLSFLALLDRAVIGTIVLIHPSRESFLLPVLTPDRGWTLEFRDSNSTIHVRTAARPVAARAAPVPLAPALEPAAIGLNSVFVRFKRTASPTAELTEAFIAGILGEHEHQVDAYRRALARAPDSWRARRMLEELGASP